MYPIASMRRLCTVWLFLAKDSFTKDKLHSTRHLRHRTDSLIKKSPESFIIIMNRYQRFSINLIHLKLSARIEPTANPFICLIHPGTHFHIRYRCRIPVRYRCKVPGRMHNYRRHHRRPRQHNLHNIPPRPCHRYHKCRPRLHPHKHSHCQHNHKCHYCLHLHNFGRPQGRACCEYTCCLKWKYHKCC